jgi:hypothetical protein
MINMRELTGKWYLKKRTFGGFDVMVQVEVQTWSDETYGNGGGGYDPERIEYQKATKSDLMELEINCM